MSLFKAMLKKDLLMLRNQKNAFLTLLIVPLVIGIIIPLIFVCLILFEPEISNLANDLPLYLVNLEPNDPLYRLELVKIVVDSIFSSYFLIIPIMTGSILASTSFVAERENKTMEALLYTPISMTQLLTSKLFSALVPSIIVTWITAIGSGLAINIPCYLQFQAFPFPTTLWLLNLFWLAPIISSLSLTFSVLVSAKSQTYQEAQQKSSLLVFPLMALIIGQVSGLYSLGAFNYFLIGLAIIPIEIFLLQRIAKNFQRENLV